MVLMVFLIEIVILTDLVLDRPLVLMDLEKYLFLFLGNFWHTVVQQTNYYLVLFERNNKHFENDYIGHVLQFIYYFYVKKIIYYCNLLTYSVSFATWLIFTAIYTEINVANLIFCS